jgi:pimeloyl-ACP methyl ester carboxylesterase
VRVVESGRDNERPIVLVPGWGCTAWIFHETLIPLAAAGFHAIAVELKGHGESDKPEREDEYTVGAMRDHLVEILDSLDLDEAGIVGHSMGAAIAAQVAVRTPRRVTGLVLVAPVGFAGVRGMCLFRLLTPQFAIPIVRRLAARPLIRMMLAVVYGSLRRASNQDVEEFYAPVRMPGTTRALRHLLHVFEWNANFPTLEVPYMCIFGSEDILSPSGDAPRYGGMRTVIIEGSGHVIFDEAPEIVNREMAEFFAPRGAPYISSQDD